MLQDFKDYWKYRNETHEEHAARILREDKLQRIATRQTKIHSDRYRKWLVSLIEAKAVQGFVVDMDEERFLCEMFRDEMIHTTFDRLAVEKSVSEQFGMKISVEADFVQNSILLCWKNDFIGVDGSSEQIGFLVTY